MSDDNAGLIQWKTNAWQNPGMVAWYSGRMTESSSTSYLKNVLELEIIHSYVTGKDVVDIGVGTGRAALSLVKAGFSVTGVDSSQAMLDETRRLAGGMSITLKQSDITKLLLKDKSYDSAVSLNVLVHFPNWREALLEWGRVIRPHGRIIFDIHSTDHALAAYGENTEEWPESLKMTHFPSNFESYMARLSTDDIIDFANEHGFVVKALVPYGAFLGGGNTNWLLYSQLDIKNSWRRMLSWFASDSDLNKLGMFIENEIIAHLSPATTGRMFVVLEKRVGKEENDKLKERLNKINELMASGSVAELISYLPHDIEYYQNSFSALLRPLRCTRFFLMLVNAILDRFGNANFLNFFPPEVLADIAENRQLNCYDQQSMAIIKKVCETEGQPEFFGVKGTASIPYPLLEILLEQFYKKFTGVRT